MARGLSPVHDDKGDDLGDNMDLSEDDDDGEGLSGDEAEDEDSDSEDDSSTDSDCEDQQPNPSSLKKKPIGPKVGVKAAASLIKSSEKITAHAWH